MTDILSRVLVAEPVYSGVHPSVYFNRIRFWQYVYSHDFAERVQVRSMVMGPRKAIRVARSEAIKTMMQHKATHLLFLDDDVLVPPDILDRLLAVDKDIVGGLMHRDTGEPLVFIDTPDGGETSWMHHPKTMAFECAAVVAGCMLVKADTFLVFLRHFGPASSPYWFNYDDTARSMDVRFCRMARDCGKQVWCLPDPPCEQIKHY